MAPPTAAATLAIARTYLGVAEDPSGSNCQLFSKRLGRPCEPWCADFLVAVARQAGLKLPSESAYTPAMAGGFREARRFGSRPAIGAFVFFEWPGMGRIAHVGIVEAIRSDGSVVSIEGNTDSGGGRTGGRVMRHVRRANIAGYGYPVYATTSTAPRNAPPATAPPFPFPADHYIGTTRPDPRCHSGRYSSADRSKIAQFARQMRSRGWRGFRTDGIYGDAEAQLVREFQAEKKLPVDGLVGPRTWRAAWTARVT